MKSSFHVPLLLLYLTLNVVDVFPIEIDMLSTSEILGLLFPLPRSFAHVYSQMHKTIAGAI